MASNDGTAAAAAVVVAKPSRPQRVALYRVCILQKRLAELSAQVEAAIVEVRRKGSRKHAAEGLGRALRRETALCVADK